MRQLSGMTISDLKGYEAMPADLQLTFGAISADIDNGIAEFERHASVPAQPVQAAKPDPECPYCGFYKPCGNCASRT